MKSITFHHFILHILIVFISLSSLSSIRYCHGFVTTRNLLPLHHHHHEERRLFHNCLTSMSATSSPSSSSSSTRKLKKKKSDIRSRLTESQLSDRRKSPALWRLTHSNENSSFSSSSSIDQAEKKRKTMTILRKPEVMSPCGGWPQVHAAIANGADSIYVGLSVFSARARASNFDLDCEEKGLPKLIQVCHSHQMKVFVALNTLVFNHELKEVESILKKCILLEVDAIIVQDLGVVKILSELLERLKNESSVGNNNIIRTQIHASTQQTVTCVDGVNFANKHGKATRVVLGRELSVDEIKSISDTMSLHNEIENNMNNNVLSMNDSSSDIMTTPPPPAEIEVFVHGALCVSYSGQCFSSEFVGGRSANRGQCAQACRLPYGLVQNGVLQKDNNNNKNNMQDISYLLSPQDLCGVDHVYSLIKAGVSCLKIEGRLKDENYVAATTRAYRNAVDKAWNQIVKEVQSSTQKEEEGNENSNNNNNIILEDTTIPRKLTAQLRDVEVTKSDLIQLFSRGQDEFHDGLSSGFLDGPNHQSLVRGNSPRHRGVFMGYVVQQNGSKKGKQKQQQGLLIQQTSSSKTSHKFKRGDGIVIDRGMPELEELGGPIYDVQEYDDGLTRILFGKQVMKKWKQNPTLVNDGDIVWKTFDATVQKKFQKLADQQKKKSSTSTATTIVDDTTNDGSSYIGEQDVNIKVTAKLNQPLQIQIMLLSSSSSSSSSSLADAALLGKAETQGILTEATSRSITKESIQKAIGTLGNTQYNIIQEEYDIEDGLFCSMGWIKEARRNAIDDLNEMIRKKLDEDTTSDSSKVKINEKDLQKLKEQQETFFDQLDIKQELLQKTTTTSPHSKNNGEIPSSKQVQAQEKNKKKEEVTIKLSVLARTLDQVDAICDYIISNNNNNNNSKSPRNNNKVVVNEIIVDFLEMTQIEQAVQKIRQAGSSSSSSQKINNIIELTLASPRIIKPNEEGIWKSLLENEPDAFLIRSTGLLYRMMELIDPETNNIQLSQEKTVKAPKLYGDFSLNAVNTLTAKELLYFGLDRITAPYDLSGNAISELISSLSSSFKEEEEKEETYEENNKLEVILHSHLPTFHTEHCVFARFLSKGNSFVDCGHVCTRNTVHLRDEQTQKDSLVLADMGCRNTVFSAEAQSGLWFVNDWIQQQQQKNNDYNNKNIPKMRIELVDESFKDSQKIIQAYDDFLTGKKSADNVWDILGNEIKDSNGNNQGVSQGALRNTVERRAGQL